jgi:hypothetical protein
MQTFPLCRIVNLDRHCLKSAPHFDEFAWEGRAASQCSCKWNWAPWPHHRKDIPMPKQTCLPHCLAQKLAKLIHLISQLPIPSSFTEKTRRSGHRMAWHTTLSIPFTLASSLCDLDELPARGAQKERSVILLRHCDRPQPHQSPMKGGLVASYLTWWSFSLSGWWLALFIFSIKKHG